jgi:hypothetical protein
MASEVLKINLNNPTSTEGFKDLSEEQKQALAKLAEQRKAAWESEIVEITSDKIAELKANLWNPDKLKEVLGMKEKGVLSTAQILAGTELEKNLWWKENLESYTKLSEEILYRYLFKWNDSLLSSLNVSEKTKKNIVIGFNFFLFDTLYSFKDIIKIWETLRLLSNHLKELLTWNYEPFVNELKNTSPAVDTNKIKEIFWWISGKLWILKWKFKGKKFKNEWENNQVFMNPKKWYDFFKAVANWNITDENIVSEIEKNDGDSLVTISKEEQEELKSIWDKWKEMIGPTIWSALGAVSWFRETLQNYKETITKNLPTTFIEFFTQLEDIPFIWELLKWLWNILGIWSWKNLLEERNFDGFKDTFTKVLSSENLLFSKLKSGNDYMIFEGKKDINFVKNISALKWNDQRDTETFLKDFFHKDGAFAKFYETARTSNLVSNIQRNSTELNYSSLSYWVSLYKEFSEAKKTNSSLSVEKFLEDKKNALKKTQDTIKQLVDTKEEITGPEKILMTDSSLETTIQVWNKWYKISLLETKDIVIKTTDSNFHFKLVWEIRINWKELFTALKEFRENINNWTEIEFPIIWKINPREKTINKIRDILWQAIKNGKLEQKDFVYKDSDDSETRFQYIPVPASSNWISPIISQNPVWDIQAVEPPKKDILADSPWEDIGNGFKKLKWNTPNNLKIAQDITNWPFLEVSISEGKKLSKILFWSTEYQITWWWSQSFSSYPSCSIDWNTLDIGWEKVNITDLYNRLKNSPQTASLSSQWDIKKV